MSQFCKWAWHWHSVQRRQNKRLWTFRLLNSRWVLNNAFCPDARTSPHRRLRINKAVNTSDFVFNGRLIGGIRGSVASSLKIPSLRRRPDRLQRKDSVTECRGRRVGVEDAGRCTGDCSRRFKVGVASRRAGHADERGHRRCRADATSLVRHRRGKGIDGDAAWQTALAAITSCRVGGLAGGGLMDCLHARMAAQRQRRASRTRVRSFGDAS